MLLRQGSTTEPVTQHLIQCLRLSEASMCGWSLVCWKLCFGNPLKGARAPSQDSHSRTKLYSLCQFTALQKTHSANFLSNSKHIHKMHFLGEIGGRQSGQAWSSPFPPWAVLVYIQPQHCVSCATEAPPEQHGAELQPAESFLCELLQHWEKGEKGNEDFFQLQMNPQNETTNPRFITSPVQARNWDT